MVRGAYLVLSFGLGCLICVVLGPAIDETVRPHSAGASTGEAVAAPAVLPAQPAAQVAPTVELAAADAPQPVTGEEPTADSTPAASDLVAADEAGETDEDLSASLAELMDPASEQALDPLPEESPVVDLASVLDPAPAETNPITLPADELVGGPAAQVIHTNYQKAMKEASEDRKMMFIYFHDTYPSASQRAFERETLGSIEIQEKLKRYVFVKLPRDAKIKVGGKPVGVLEHRAFVEMLGRQGVAVIDFTRPEADYYGHVVSTFPFTPGKYFRKEALSIVLDLPPGTLTQRTMIYAVRVHPEAPKSTQGQFHTVLANEAKQHANYQASILVQGHHSWDSRFHRINAQLPGGVLAQEVVAESWPNESLVEACIDCVDSWRQSPGHWGAVHSRHPLFGYDIKRGRNGIWYATGIFGRR